MFYGVEVIRDSVNEMNLLQDKVLGKWSTIYVLKNSLVFEIKTSPIVKISYNHCIAPQWAGLVKSVKIPVNQFCCL